MSKTILFKYIIAFPVIIFCLPAFIILQQIFSDSKILPAENFPRWLMNKNYRTYQTSGITYLRQLVDGSKEFLLADDVGNIHRFFIKDDTVFNFRKIEFNKEVVWYLEDFPKPDFEEIFYDRYTDEVYITIEGNGKTHLDFQGIYNLKFKDDNIYLDTLVGLEKLKFFPVEKFYNNLNKNSGYEGFTADENYFYMGLEAVLTSNKSFSGHTIIRIADKKSLEIVKEFSTDSLGISTVCGLYSDKNFSLWGIDRNQKKVFKLLLDEYLNVVEINLFVTSAVIPNNHKFEYIGALESITLTPDQNIYLIDDPWTERFVPAEKILKKLDSGTVDNFKNMMPIIYKYYVE